MSGIIDIRVITESPCRLALLSAAGFFLLSSWNVPASILHTLPGMGSLGPVRQANLFKALLVAAVVWFLLRYKRSWVLEAVSAGTPMPGTDSTNKAT